LAKYSSWFVFAPARSFGTSLTGNATTYTGVPDRPGSFSTIPSWTLSGAGGSDVLTFNSSGVYLLIYSFSVNTSSATLNTVLLASNSVLSGVTVLANFADNGSSLGEDYLDDVFLATSCDIVGSVSGGTITYPTSVDLTSLYGTYWSYTAVQRMAIVCLS